MDELRHKQKPRQAAADESHKVTLDLAPATYAALRVRFGEDWRAGAAFLLDRALRSD